MPRPRIRPLSAYEELEAGVELQRRTWGRDFDDIVSAALMRVSQKIGGISAGAFDEDDRLVGMVFGLSGIRGDERVHWSHMLAVEPEQQGRGLGTALKAYQRRRVLPLGVRIMYWTFDPLISRNAHFNLNRLGARIERYEEDLYGPGETSPLHRGIGTDRFVAAWSLVATDVRRRMEAIDLAMKWDDSGVVADVELPIDAPVFETARHEVVNRALDEAHSPRNPLTNLPSSRPAKAPDPATPPPSKDAPDTAAPPPSTDATSPDVLSRDADSTPVFVEIPADIQKLKSDSPAEASAWRSFTRATFTRLLAAEFAVTGFVRDPATGRCFYILDRPRRP